MDDFSRFFIFSFIENWTSMQIAQKSVSKSIQNECAADTAGGVQRGLGMLPQQANLRRLTQRENRENEWTCTGWHCLLLVCVFHSREVKILYSESQYRLLFRKVWSTMDVINCWIFSNQIEEWKWHTDQSDRKKELRLTVSIVFRNRKDVLVRWITDWNS